MSRLRVAIIVFSIFSLTFMTGCIGVNKEFRDIRNIIFSNSKLEFKKEIEFSVGPGGMALAGMFVRFADDEDGRDISEIIGDVSRVQIGIYKNEKKHKYDTGFSFLKDINEEMNNNGWYYIVRAVEHNELAAVYIKDDGNENLREAFIIALNDEDLVFANIYGNLNGLIETAIKQNGIHFEMVNN